MELKILEAFKRLQEEYCWYDRIFISNESGSEEVPLDEKIEKLQKKNFSAKEISTILSELYGLGKNEIYKRVLDLS